MNDDVKHEGLGNRDALRAPELRIAKLLLDLGEEGDLSECVRGLPRASVARSTPSYSAPAHRRAWRAGA